MRLKKSVKSLTVFAALTCLVMAVMTGCTYDSGSGTTTNAATNASTNQTTTMPSTSGSNQNGSGMEGNQGSSEQTGIGNPSNDMQENSQGNMQNEQSTGETMR